MQHYLHYGYGFSASLLTEAEFQRIMGQNHNFEIYQYGLGCVSFTEDSGDREWSSIVLYSFGEVNIPAKMITMAEINDINTQYGTLSKETNDIILNILTSAGLEHYMDKVDLIFYSDNY